MAELISEPITPFGKDFDAQAMSRGEPGLPSAFTWRDSVYHIDAVLDRWKLSSREGATAQGELYLRRHYFRLRMTDSQTWTIYFIRQAPRSGKLSARWFLYTIGPDV